jgi:putative ABC transport system permease protein
VRPHGLDGLEREIRDHVERETHDNIDRGMTPEDARRAALVAFGNVAIAQEDVRAVWIPIWLEHTVQDIRYAFRSVLRNPIFSATVVLTLALGIGLSATVLAPFESILLRPLDYPDAERLVSIRITNPDLAPDDDIATNQEYWALRDHVTSLDRVIAYQVGDQTLTTGNKIARVHGAWVTDDFWDVTGGRAMAGRLPTRDEQNVAVLSERLYLSMFAGDPNVLGQVVTLDGVEATVIGVISSAFRFEFPVPAPSGGPQPKDIDVLRSFTVSAPTRNFAQLLSIAGRLKPAVAVVRARAELASLPVDRPFSRNAAHIAIRVDTTAERLVRSIRPALNVLMASVVFVLLIACANITNLLLARATVRRKEIAVRMSVGAGRTRVLRQFLFESAIYSATGGLVGLLLARSSLVAIVRAYPQTVPRLAESSIHGSVVLVVLGVLTATTFFFGLVPAFFVQRSDMQSILKEGTRTATSSPDWLRIRTLLAAVQLALAVTLLTGAGLMAKSFWRMNDHPAGFEPEHILTLRVDFPRGTTNRAKRDYTTRVLARLKTLPDVAAVSLNTHGDSLTKLEVAGAPPSSSDATPTRIYANQTSADFARVMGLQLLKGRWFTDDEPAPVVVLNETLAKLRFGREDPIGRRVKGPDFGEPSESRGRNADAESEVATVVGVIADLRYSKLDEEATPELYVPYAMTPGIYRLSVVIKTPGDPRAIIPSVRGAFGEIARTETPFDIEPLDQSLSASIAPRRLNLLVLATFAVAALVLALIGIYGVMSYSVSQRTHEIGVRSAVGATSRDIVGMVVWQGVRLAAVGVAAGIAGAQILTREMGSLLFEVKPTDPATVISAAGVLAVTALVASAIPAVKAGAVDPMVALRYE